MTNVRLYILMILLTLMLIFFQYHFWFDSGGMRDMLQIKKILAQQIIINDKLKNQNETLLLQIQRMQSGQETAELRARRELGMIKKGEIFYQIVQNEK